MSVALTLCLGLLLGQDAASQSRSARHAGRYLEALEHAARVGEPSERSLLLVEARYHGGDMGGALSEARDGLEHAPGDRNLLFYAARIALDLRVSELAEDAVERLGVAVQDAPLGDDVSAAWRGTAEGFSEELAHLLDAEEQRVAATRRARWVGLGGVLATAFGALALLLRRS